MMKADGWLPVLSLFGIALLGSVVQFESPVAAWKDVLTRLYYIPIVIAAISLGIRAAMSVALAAGICSALASTAVTGDPWIRPLAETILFVCVGIAAARMTQVHESLLGRASTHYKGQQALRIDNSFQDAHGIQQAPGFRQIVAGLVRRFRTPVSSIEGAVWLLADARFPDDKCEEFVRIIRKESRELDTALADILEFTQPRSPRPRKVNLSQLLDEVIELVGPKDHGHFFLFRNDIAPNLPSLNCDQELIGKVLLNLASNAIQAMPGGGQIIFAAYAEAGSVVISVRDHGRGIPLEIVDRIFDPFFTTREGGLGLGLTVARQIVAAHGGTIAVEENPGKGTCVSVVLPLRPPNPHEHGSHIGG